MNVQLCWYRVPILLFSDARRVPYNITVCMNPYPTPDAIPHETSLSSSRSKLISEIVWSSLLIVSSRFSDSCREILFSMTRSTLWYSLTNAHLKINWQITDVGIMKYTAFSSKNRNGRWIMDESRQESNWKNADVVTTITSWALEYAKRNNSERLGEKANRAQLKVKPNEVMFQ